MPVCALSFDIKAPSRPPQKNRGEFLRRAAPPVRRENLNLRGGRAYSNVD